MKFIFFSLVVILLSGDLRQITGSRSPLETFKYFYEQENIDMGDDDDEGFHKLTLEYDFIIVGGGTAGCVLANRLSENPEWDVLLIEAGGNEYSYMDVPLVTEHLQSSKELNYNYKSKPNSRYCLAMRYGTCLIPRGKVLGGSSVLDYALYSRGHRMDYDNWARLGNKGWSFKEVLPYFKKIENFTVPKLFNKIYHGNRGPLSINYPPYRTKLAEVLMEASADAKWTTVDYNARTMNGISYAQTTIQGGMKRSSNAAYLRKARKRPNLSVKKNMRVLKIIVEKKDGKNKAVGVEVELNLSFFWSNRVRAKKEVIVTAGAIGSPQLLMLSGIGPKPHLRNVNIPLVQNLKVGYNLMDHVAIGGLIFEINDTTTLTPEKNFNSKEINAFLDNHQSPLSLPAGLEICSFHNINKSKHDVRPDLGLFYMDSGTITHRVMRAYRNINETVYEDTFEPIRKKNTFAILPTLLHPVSRGRVMLKKKVDKAHPSIYPNYFEKSKDLNRLIDGVKYALQVTSRYDMLKMGTEIYQKPLAGCKHEEFATDPYWKCLASHLTFSMHSLCGTCKMGPNTDKGAVVNPRLQVYGIESLRVADASIIPEITSAPIGAAVYMIAEKAADLIKEDYSNDKK